MEKTFTESEVIGLIYLASFSYEHLTKDNDETTTLFVNEMLRDGFRFGGIFGVTEDVYNCIETVKKRMLKDIEKAQQSK